MLTSKIKITLLSFCIVTVGIFVLFVISSFSQPIQKMSPEKSLEQLNTLGYVTWNPVEETNKKGVTKFDPLKACSGVNIFLSEHKLGAQLIDMNGDVLHELFDTRSQKDGKAWRHIIPFGDQHFLVLVENTAIFMIDWDSKIKWEKRMPVHHDITTDFDGNIYTLTKEKILIPTLDRTQIIPIYDNFVVILSQNGELKKKISFYQMYLKNKECLKYFKKFSKFHLPDVFHTNTVAVLNRNIIKNGKYLFKKGSILFSCCHLHTIGIIDIEKEEIVWSWGPGELSYQHQPSFLSNNNILVFDNGRNRKRSRIVEVDPRTKKITWEYIGDPPESFYTKTRGGVQRLPNGNTLITETNKGRVFEITRDKKIVWEFFNPKLRKTDKGTERPSIYRMMRIVDSDRYPRLKNYKDISCP